MVKAKGIDTIDPASYTAGMGMGRRKDRARTPRLWVATNELPTPRRPPVRPTLNQVLDAHAFDEFVEGHVRPGNG